MTVVGVGVDAVELDRMRRALERTPGLATRTFTEAERSYCEARRDPTERYAARFAAKEAVLKVLDQGILGVRLSDIEVVKAPSGKPSIVLHGNLAVAAAAAGITTWQLSLTHTHTLAQAVVVGLAEPVATAEVELIDVLMPPADVVDQWDDRVFFAGLDRKRNAAGALFFDATARLLIVKPTYRDGWTIPGGAVDAGESPRQACEREITEELGLHRSVGELRLTDWNPGDDVEGESLLWIFAGGVLSDGEIATIRLPADELSEHRFVDPDEAVALTGPPAAARRLALALAVEPGRTAYAEDGQLVTATPGPLPG